MNRSARTRPQVALQQKAFRPHIEGLVYAVGDVHGRLDLMERMIDRIRQDASMLGPDAPTIVLLGDLIDRGPASAGCIDRAIRLAGESWCRTEFLLGNHEQSLLKFLEDPTSGEPWMRHGGDATIASYGVDPRQASRAGWAGLQGALAAAVPQSHRDYLAGSRLWLGLGDYIFVHAGVRPGALMEAQTVHDLLLIRQPFLGADMPYPGKVVVHGHTPMPQPRVSKWAIGVDTGAYASGVLTAVRLRGFERMIIQTI